jgi:hypothetical protein
MSEVPLVPGPIYGLRTWHVAGEPGHERLVGSYRSTPWPRGGSMLDAECSASPPHSPPGKRCTCGLHAWHPSRAAARRVCGFRGEVPGILEASGAVEVHADGFRAERGRPHALAVLPNRNARQLQRLADAYEIELLRLDGPDGLFAYCRDRGLGLSEDVVAELVGTEKLTADRRRRRRRGVLAAVWIVILALLLGGIAVAVHPEVQHGKTLKGRSGEIQVP